MIEGSKFLTNKTIEDFLITAEKSLCVWFDLPECRIFLWDFKANKMYRFDHKSKEKLEFNLIGIIGKTITMNWEFNTENGYNDPSFNDQVDITTTMPLHIRPFRHFENQKVCLGGIEIINWKGILGRQVAGFVTIDMTSNEILEAFAHQLVAGIVKNFFREEDVKLI